MINTRKQVSSKLLTLEGWKASEFELELVKSNFIEVSTMLWLRHHLISTGNFFN